MRGPSQKIGQDAESALHANRPELWSLATLGGADYGIDYVVTVLDDEDRAQLFCNLQLKGTTQASARLTDGLHLSHVFDCNTLHLWHGSFTPVLIAVADLVDGCDPRDATVHYEFVSPYIGDVLLGTKPDQSTVTLRVQRANLVNRELDILPIVQPYIDEVRELHRQRRDRKLASGEAEVANPLAAVKQLDAPIVATDVLPASNAIEAAIVQTESRERLAAALSAIRSGDIGMALSLTEEPTEADLAEPSMTSAVNAYLRAKAYEYIGDDEHIDHLLAIALAKLPENSDVIAAVAQRRLEDIPYGASGDEARNELIQWLGTAEGPAVATVVAKAQALNRNFDAARSTLSDVPQPKAAITGLIVSIVEGDWQRVLIEAEEARHHPNQTPIQSLLVNVLKARAHFQLALGPVQWPEDGELVIPAAGLAGMDLAALHEAYDCSLRAMYMAQVAGWPSATNYLLDVLPISAMALGKMDEAMPLLAALGRAHATQLKTRETVIKFALNADQPRLALQLSELAGDGPRFCDEDALLAVAACRVDDVATAFSFINTDTLSSDSNSDIYLSALMAIGVAADSAMRQDILTDIRVRLARTVEGLHFLAILESAVHARKSALNRSEAINLLFSRWEEYGRPPVISRHLLINADPEDEHEASLVQTVGARLQATNAMDAEQWATFAQALITLGNYNAAIGHLLTACEQFGDDPRLASLLAIAYEHRGDIAEAFRRFERLIESGAASETARRYFINSAARVGFIEEAEAQVRNVLARSTNNRARLRHIQTLFQLGLLSAKAPDELWRLAWEYGQLASPEDERQEGTFLQLVFAARMSYQPEASDAREVEFVRRRDAFLETFPNSKMIRKFDVPNTDSAESVARALQAAIGITEDDVRRGLRIERGLDAGTLHIPFSWRPKRFLRDVPDVLALWKLRATKPEERRAWHFSSVAEDGLLQTPQNLADWVPVISLTSLLVLDACGLLDLVFRSFEKVVVARATLIALQDAHNPITAGYGRDIAYRIMATLRAHIGKVMHPPVTAGETGDFGPEWHQEERAAMSVSGRVYFSDDTLETIAVCSGDEESDALGPRSMCTVDFLTWADQTAGLISPQEVACHLASLVRLNIVVNIQGRYFVAAIPAELQNAHTKAEVDAAVAGAHTLNVILDGIWNPLILYKQLLSHFASVMAYLMTHNASDAVVESLWLRWLQAVRLQQEPAAPPIAKLSSAFVVTAEKLFDANAIRRLWVTYWRTIEAGAAYAVVDAPDRAGVIAVAELLGSASAADRSPRIADVSQRVRSALGTGTELDGLYSQNYVRAAAERAVKPDTDAV